MEKTISGNIFNVQNYFWKVLCLIIIIVAAIGSVACLTPIHQDVSYHIFADNNKLFGIQNASNVVSNIFFLIAGIVGIHRLKNNDCSFWLLRWRFFFFSMILVGIGSAYYHWAPSNDRLFWDRLPMTLGFASLTANLFIERLKINTPLSKMLFVLLIVMSVFSVVYWWFTEKNAVGDLRFYILVQFLPLVLVPMLLILFSNGIRKDKVYWILLFGYIIAKVAEWRDLVLYQWSIHIISGHTLKHIIAGIAILVFCNIGINGEKKENN